MKESRMQQFRRWAPLLGTLVLVVATALRLVGHGEAAALVEAIGAMAGVTPQSPVSPTELAPVVGQLVALLAVIWGIARKVAAEVGRV